jgi:hypothetical protein
MSTTVAPRPVWNRPFREGHVDGSPNLSSDSHALLSVAHSASCPGCKPSAAAGLELVPPVEGGLAAAQHFAVAPSFARSAGGVSAAVVFGVAQGGGFADRAKAPRLRPIPRYTHTPTDKQSIGTALGEVVNSTDAVADADPSLLGIYDQRATELGERISDNLAP